MYEIEGPYSFKAVDGLKTPVYIFVPGGEKKIIGEATVKVDGGMTFDIQMDEDHQDIETGSFEVPMRFTARHTEKVKRPNWSFNCLTGDVHHGRPEKLWNLPLIYAVEIFEMEDLRAIVVARIYNDAMQYVECSPFTQRGTDKTVVYTQEWADRVKTASEELYSELIETKVKELGAYYGSSHRQSDIQNPDYGVVALVKQNKLNPHYEPLHSHDSINLFCRILAHSAMYKADK